MAFVLYARRRVGRCGARGRSSAYKATANEYLFADRASRLVAMANERVLFDGFHGDLRDLSKDVTANEDRRRFSEHVGIRATSGVQSVCFLSEGRLKGEDRLVPVACLSAVRKFRVLNHFKFHLGRGAVRLARAIRIEDVRAARVSLRNDRGVAEASSYLLADDDVGVRRVLKRAQVRNDLNQVGFETYLRHVRVIRGCVVGVVRISANLVLRVRLSVAKYQVAQGREEDGRRCLHVLSSLLHARGRHACRGVQVLRRKTFFPVFRLGGSEAMEESLAAGGTRAKGRHAKVCDQFNDRRTICAIWSFRYAFL